MTNNHANTHDHYRIELVGSDTAVCPDLELSYTAPRPKSRDPIGPLARRMVAAGPAPEATEEAREKPKAASGCTGEC